MIPTLAAPLSSRNYDVALRPLRSGEGTLP